MKDDGRWKMEDAYWAKAYPSTEEDDEDVIDEI